MGISFALSSRVSTISWRANSNSSQQHCSNSPLIYWLDLISWLTATGTQSRDHHSLEGKVCVFIFLRNRIAILCPRQCFPFPYDSQSYDRRNQPAFSLVDSYLILNLTCWQHSFCCCLHVAANSGRCIVRISRPLPSNMSAGHNIKKYQFFAKSLEKK
jgi:hypothetical protein